MSYLDIAQLTDDPWFQARVRACTVQEAQVEHDRTPAGQALANDALRGGGGTTLAFVRLIASSPGFVSEGNGSEPVAPPEVQPPGPPRFDQSRISDGAILAQVQAQWETVAAMFFDQEGAPAL